MVTVASRPVEEIAVEHELMRSLYQRIVEALHAGPSSQIQAAAMLEELVARVAEHFSHEEEGGYYSEIAEMAPWKAAEVEELKREHVHLLSTAVQIARDARKAIGSERLCALLRNDFADFLCRCVVHEATENRLVQEVHSLDIGAGD